MSCSSHALLIPLFLLSCCPAVLLSCLACTQAVAAVIMCEGITHVQLHDYHGGISLQYLPAELRPAVLYVAHNAHCNATFPVPSDKRRFKVMM